MSKDTKEIIVKVPTHLENVFYDFIECSVMMIESAGGKESWTTEEKEIVEWLKTNKWTNIKQ